MVALSGYFDSHKLLLAPMAGVSDVVFRKINREFGADLTYTEMVSAKGLSYANEKTRHLIDLDDAEDQVAVQIFGHEPDVMAKQAAWIEDELGERLAYIDVNMGCPARKIVSKGDGSALMNAPALAEDIVRAVSRAVEHPLTCKFRRGYKVGEESCVEFAKRLEQVGAAALTVHGRFAMQMYAGKADWGAIARVVSAVAVPVVGNGDVVSGDDVLRMLDQTGCAAVMIGRGAEGNPWLFAEGQAALAGEAFAGPTILERLDMARRHASMLNALTPRSMVKMRKHAMWYVAGLPGASAARARFNYCNTLEDFYQVFDELEGYIDAAPASC